MLRYFFISFLLVVIAVLALAGFRGEKSSTTPLEIFPDMVRQPRYDAQHETTFFADTRAARPPAPGTVPLGYNVAGTYSQTGVSNNRTLAGGTDSRFSAIDDYYNTGKIGDSYGDGFPVQLSEAVMLRGQQRFIINCSPCHGATGYGNGIVSQYGLVAVANFHDTRLRTMPDGQIFNTITYGKNTMGAYGPQISVEDRWAIIAYIRALERSQHASLSDVPEQEQASLQQPVKK